MKRESSVGDARACNVKFDTDRKCLPEEITDKAEMLAEEFLSTTKLNGANDIL